MRKPLAVTLATVAAGTAVAVPASALSSSGEDPTASAARTRTVAVRDNVFSPTSVSARRNDVLQFRWNGDNPHNVRARSGPVRFNSGTPKTSGTYRVTVRRTGSYAIVCDVHPRMRMSLRVR